MDRLNLMESRIRLYYESLTLTVELEDEMEIEGQSNDNRANVNIETRPMRHSNEHLL